MNATPQDHQTDQPMSRLLRDALTSVESILRSEFRLAKTEVSRDARQAGIAGGMLAAGGLLGLYAFGMLLSATVELLEKVMPEWLAGLVVSLTVGAIAAFLAISGLERLKEADLVPRETMESLGQDIQIG